MKNQRIILISVLAGVIIVILVAVLNVLLTQKKLNLYNIDQIDNGLTGYEVKELEDYVWQSLQRTQGFDDDKTEIVALVRPSSFRKTTNGEVRNYDFLIDIDEYKATYRVAFALVGNNGLYEAPMVDCPAPSLMKYPETYCMSEKTSTASITIGRELPKYLNLATGELAIVTLNRDETGTDYLNVRVSSCGDSSVVERAREAVEAWIELLGYKKSEYEIRIPEFCDGASS